MIPVTKVGIKKLSDYRNIIDAELHDEILKRAKDLQGMKVIHLNATSVGGGVAEMLQALVPLMNDIGLNAEWRTIPPNTEFFNVTKKMHNTLQGLNQDLSDSEKNIYLSYNEKLAKYMKAHKPDIWIIHDPQPLASFSFLNSGHRAVWRCHIDTTNRHPSAWEFVKPYLKGYEKYIFSIKDFLPNDIDQKKVVLIPPAIDPLSEKNIAVDTAEANKILVQSGINHAHPLITQVSRFDPWKDPKGVIDVYRIARKHIPNLQLAILGLIIAKDDPEAYEIYEDVKNYAGDDSNIFLFADPNKIPTTNDIFVRAFQTASDVVIQKSLREGFGLVVTEAMWKGKPVIGGNVGGIRIQIQDGVNGFLVNSVEEASQRLIEMMNDSEKLKIMSKAARESVRKNFLIPRLLNDYLKILKEI